jgi:SAM-dependent methyltransferase
LVGLLGDDDRARIVALYEDRLAVHGDDAKTVGWGSARDQQLRFEVLCRGIEPTGRTVLDVGCGLGDLVPFLDGRTGGNYDYTGVDLSERLVERAKQRFGGERRSFLTADLLETDLGSFDVILLSGALSFRVSDNVALAQSMLSRMFQMARVAMAGNFLSSYVDCRLDKNFHYSPEKMFGFAKTLTRYVSLHHDYPLYEFTLQLFRHA